MEDFALSLLISEKKSGKKNSEKLMKHLKPESVDKIENIQPRQPWMNQPDCLNCHVNFKAPETDTADINQWTKAENQLYHMRSDDVGIRCAGCHGIAHAEYPAIYDKDNIQPLQYQKNPYPIASNKNCKVCHTKDMEEEVHHPNFLNMFRNTK
jgi:hypothetical protein